MDYKDILEKHGDDSLVEVLEYSSGRLVLRVLLDAIGGREIRIISNRPYHLDMPPKLMLGTIQVGDCHILPDGYLNTRNRGYDGDEGSWQVMRITDDEQNEYYAILSAVDGTLIFLDGNI